MSLIFFFMLMIHSLSMLQYYSQLSLLNKITTNVIARSQKNDLLQASPKFVDSLLIIIVSNNLTINSYSDIMNFAGSTLGQSYFSVIRVVQGSGAKWRDLYAQLGLCCGTRPLLYCGRATCTHCTS